MSLTGVVRTLDAARETLGLDRTVDEVLHPANDSTAPGQHYFLVKPGMLDKLPEGAVLKT